VSTRKNGQGYKISDDFWTKIKPLIPLPKPKKKSGRPRKDNKIIRSDFFSPPLLYIYEPEFCLPITSAKSCMAVLLIMKT